jgi:putative ABC transport system permease protein
MVDRARGWWKRLRGTLRRADAERELNEEFAHHLELEVAENMRRGLSPAQARRAAHVAFGGAERHAERVREVRNFHGLEVLAQDLRHAVRSFGRAPGFTAVLVGTLALGIGGAAAIFSVVDAVVLKPLPYPEPDALVDVQEVNPDGLDFTASEPNYLDFAAQNRSLSALGAYRVDAVALAGDAPAQLSALSASRSLADALGVRLLLGRMFTADEDRPGADARVVVLSEPLWRSRFGADPDVVGTALLLEGTRHEVIGVLAAESNLHRADLWQPLAADPGRDRGDHWLSMVGRLAPGVTREQAQADLAGLAARIGAQHPEVAGWGVRVQPLADAVVGPAVRQAGWLLLGAVTFLLLIACANVTNLLLARATSRQTDFSVRIALGAGAGRLTRQLLTESALLAAAGGVLGVLGAYAAVGALRWAAQQPGGPAFVPRIEDVGVDGRMLVFALAVTAVTALLVGLLPARQAASVSVHDALKQGGRAGGSASQRTVRNALVVCQLAVSVLLLIGGGLMMRSMLALDSVDAGFDTEHLWSVRLQPLDTDYPEEWQRARFYNVVSSRIAAVPGVVAAGGTVVDPFTGLNLVNDVTPEERAAETPSSGFMQAAWRVVTPDGYFEAAGIPLLRGRLFTFDSDRFEGEHNVIITQSMAERLWPDADPIGRRLYWGGTSGRTRTVVGVVGDIRDVSLDAPVQPTMFLPSSQLAWYWMVIVVRTAGPVDGVTDAIRAAIHDVDPNMVAPEIRRVSDSRAAVLAQPRLQAWTLGIFAALALALAGIGLYGVLAFSVAQRTREIGVRMALGAGYGNVVQLMIRRGLVLTLMGLAGGLAAAAALSRYIHSLLFDVAPLDPITYAAVAAVMVLVGLLATALPARRAARVDPLVSLRGEG